MNAQARQQGSVAAPTAQDTSAPSSPRRGAPGPRRPALRAVRALLAVSRVPVLVLGVLAGLHLMSLSSARPVFCLVQIDGQSMEPTFRAGEQAAFARLPWHEGSVVVADVGEPNLVVKRVKSVREGRVFITGDNTQVTETYRVSEEDIRAVLVCRVPFSSPVVEESARPVSASRHREPSLPPPGLTGR